MAGDQPAARSVAGRGARAREGHRSRPPGDAAAAGRSLHAAATSWRRWTSTWRASSAKRARSTREEQVAAAEIERLEAARKQLSETMAQRQLELEAVTGERHRTEEELAERRQRGGRTARRNRRAEERSVREIRARKESLEQVLAHRTYTTESVKRLFAALEKGKAEDLKPLGVLADFVEVDPQFEKPAEEFLHDELEYVVVESWQQAERGPGFHPRRTGRPRHVPGASGAERQRQRRICRSRPSARKPASPRGSAIRCGSPTASAIAPPTCCRAFRCASWPRTAPPRSAWRWPIRTSISCCPTASAITATP